MISWVVPLEDYPDTYNGKPLAYAALASQKNHFSVYLMGLYTDGPEESWFREQYAERGLRLDMGKSCVRFRASTRCRWTCSAARSNGSGRRVSRPLRGRAGAAR